jgi:5-methylcytosine-specific restriction endonuclease McrA
MHHLFVKDWKNEYCLMCKEKYQDHILLYNYANMVIACAKCNEKKGHLPVTTFLDKKIKKRHMPFLFL